MEQFVVAYLIRRLLAPGGHAIIATIANKFLLCLFEMFGFTMI